MTQGKLSVNSKPPGSEGQGDKKDNATAPPAPPSYEEATAGEGMKSGNFPAPPAAPLHPSWAYVDPSTSPSYGSGGYPGDSPQPPRGAAGLGSGPQRSPLPAGLCHPDGPAPGHRCHRGVLHLLVGAGCVLAPGRAPGSCVTPAFFSEYSNRKAKLKEHSEVAVSHPLSGLDHPSWAVPGQELPGFYSHSQDCITHPGLSPGRSCRVLLPFPGLDHPSRAVPGQELPGFTPIPRTGSPIPGCPRAGAAGFYSHSQDWITHPGLSPGRSCRVLLPFPGLDHPSRAVPGQELPGFTPIPRTGSPIPGCPRAGAAGFYSHSQDWITHPGLSPGRSCRVLLPFPGLDHPSRAVPGQELPGFTPIPRTGSPIPGCPRAGAAGFYSHSQDWITHPGLSPGRSCRVLLPFPGLDHPSRAVPGQELPGFTPIPRTGSPIPGCPRAGAAGFYSHSQDWITHPGLSPGRSSGFLLPFPGLYHPSRAVPGQAHGFPRGSHQTAAPGRAPSPAHPLSSSDDRALGRVWLVLPPDPPLLTPSPAQMTERSGACGSCCLQNKLWVTARPRVRAP
uniref:Uncharacterized protein n=1 Tax=Ficedula albicollis TaxID=59894 RepID=U3JPX6_FICAL